MWHLLQLKFLCHRVASCQSLFLGLFYLWCACKSVAFRILSEFVGEDVESVGIGWGEQQGKQGRQFHHDAGVCNTLPQSEAADPQTMEKNQSLEIWDMDNSKIAAWGIYKWDNFISFWWGAALCVAAVALCIAAVWKRGDRSGGQHSLNCCISSGTGVAQWSRTAGERCYGEPALLQQPCAWFTSLGFSCDQESEAAKCCCGQRAWRMGPDCHGQWWCELLPAWCLATSKNVFCKKPHWAWLRAPTQCVPVCVFVEESSGSSVELEALLEAGGLEMDNLLLWVQSWLSGQGFPGCKLGM